MQTTKVSREKRAENKAKKDELIKRLLAAHEAGTDTKAIVRDYARVAASEIKPKAPPKEKADSPAEKAARAARQSDGRTLRGTEEILKEYQSGVLPVLEKVRAILVPVLPHFRKACDENPKLADSVVITMHCSRHEGNNGPSITIRNGPVKVSISTNELDRAIKDLAEGKTPKFI